MTIFTIGHSTHTPEDFIRIAKLARLDGIIDVRSHRTSHWSWWYESEIDTWLRRDAGFSYWSAPSLGGWDIRHAPLTEWAAERGVNLTAYTRGFFPKQRIGAPREGTTGQAWTNQGLYDYAWFTATAEFLNALDQLESDFGRNDQPRIAIMCAELLWWKCHRSMIADALAFRGVPTWHVMPNPQGVRIPQHDANDRIGRYPGEVLSAWVHHRKAMLS